MDLSLFPYISLNSTSHSLSLFHSYLPFLSIPFSLTVSPSHSLSLSLPHTLSNHSEGRGVREREREREGLGESVTQ